MARPKSSNAKCIKGFQVILDRKPKGVFTTEDVAEWCNVTRKFAYQIVAFGISNGYCEVVRRDKDGSFSYFQFNGSKREWLTRRWTSGSLDDNKQESSGADVQVCNGQHREENNIRDSAADAIQASKQFTSLLSKTPSERAEFRRLWRSSSS